MKKKLLLQDLAAQLATGSGLTRKESESFARAFFEVIESGLLEDKFVKIKGFGTFKLIVVSERESVNVNTGERFQIGRHSKVSFTPEATLKELVNRPFAHFEAVDLNDGTDVAELNSVDGGLAEEAAEAEDALAATEWAEERAEIAAETEEENALTVSGVQNDIEAEKENGREPAETDSDKRETNADKGETDSDKGETGTDKKETGVDEKETVSDEGETDEANDIRVSPPTPISRGEQASEEETPSPLPAAPAPVPQEPTPADAPAATVSVAENVTESAADTPEQTAPKTQQAAKEPQQASPKPQPTAPNTQQTAQAPQQAAAQNGTQSASSDKQCLNAAGEGAVSISYTETPRPAGRNWWKTATLTICVLLLMALSYFAGYFQLLCPCTFLGREVPPPALPSRPQHAPAPESRPAPAQTSAAPADTQQQSETAGGAPAATNGKAEPTPGKDAATTCKDAAESGKDTPESAKNAANNGKNATEAEEGKCAPAQPAAPAADNALPRTHKVKAGDNLSRLSRRYYGSDKHIDFIIKTNKLRDADNIPLGSTLTFPPLPQTGR